MQADDLQHGRQEAEKRDNWAVPRTPLLAGTRPRWLSGPSMASPPPSSLKYMDNQDT